jgi:mono/diheme cytochrome c family protein
MHSSHFNDGHASSDVSERGNSVIGGESHYPLRCAPLVSCALLSLFLLCAEGVPGQANTASPTAAATLPDGPGKEIVARKCVKCHTIDKVTKERHTGSEWRELIRKMEVQGLEISPAEVDTVVRYLKENFGKPEPLLDRPKTTRATTER